MDDSTLNMKKMKMKIIIFMALGILASNNNLSAQETNKLNMAFSTKGNFQAHTVHYYELDSYYSYNENTEMVGAALNASLGLSGNIPLSSSLAFSRDWDIRNCGDFAQLLSGIFQTSLILFAFLATLPKHDTTLSRPISS